MKCLSALCFLLSTLAVSAQPFTFNDVAFVGSLTAPEASAVAVDMFYDGEGTPDATVTLTAMTNQCHAVTVGTFASDNGDPNTNTTFRAAAQLGTLRNSVLCNGTTYTGAGSTGFRMSQEFLATTQIAQTLAANQAAIQFGCFVRYNGSGLFTTQTSPITIQQVTSGYGGVQGKADGLPVFSLRAHGSVTPNVGANITAATQTVYWVQGVIRKTVGVEIGVYSYPAFACLGYSSNGVSATDINVIQFPRIANGAIGVYTIDCDNLVLNWTSPCASGGAITNTPWP